MGLYRHYWGVLIQQNDITMDCQMRSDLMMSAPNPTCRWLLLLGAGKRRVMVAFITGVFTLIFTIFRLFTHLTPEVL